MSAHRKLTLQDQMHVRDLANKGRTIKQIAEITGYAKSTVERVLRALKQGTPV
jgi:IS30 family transposase